MATDVTESDSTMDGEHNNPGLNIDYQPPYFPPPYYPSISTPMLPSSNLHFNGGQTGSNHFANFLGNAMNYPTNQGHLHSYSNVPNLTNQSRINSSSSALQLAPYFTHNPPYYASMNYMTGNMFVNEGSVEGTGPGNPFMNCAIQPAFTSLSNPSLTNATTDQVIFSVFKYHNDTVS